MECFLKIVYGDRGNTTFWVYSQEYNITQETYILPKDNVTCQKIMVMWLSVKESNWLDNKVFFNLCLMEIDDVSGKHLYSNDQSEVTRVKKCIVGQG